MRRHQRQHGRLVPSAWLWLAGATLALAACTTTDGNSAKTEFSIPTASATVGERVGTADGTLVTVHGLDLPASATDAHPEPGTAFGALDVEVCAGDSGSKATIMPDAFWLKAGEQVLRPVGPVKKPDLRPTALAPNNCTRGWITFSVPAGTTPQSVVLTGSTFVTWRLQ